MLSNSNPVCLLCLNIVNTYQGRLPLSQEEGRVVNYLLKRFVHFTKTFLGVENADRTLNVNCKESEDVSPIKCPVFCETCEVKVIEMLEMYTELKTLECKLLGKVMVVGEMVEKSSKPLKDKGFPIQSLTAIATQLESNVHYLLVELYRIRMTEKCKVKSQRILPKLDVPRFLTNKDIKPLIHKMNSLPEKGKGDVNSLAVLIIMCYLYNDWNLSFYPELRLTRPVDFVTVGYGSDQRIPTRETFSMFITVIVLCAIGLGWKLEEIVVNYPSDNCLPQRFPATMMKKIRKWNKRRVKIKTEVAGEDGFENDQEHLAFAYSPAPSPCSSFHYEDAVCGEPESKKQSKTKRNGFLKSKRGRPRGPYKERKKVPVKIVSGSTDDLKEETDGINLEPKVMENIPTNKKGRKRQINPLTTPVQIDDSNDSFSSHNAEEDDHNYEPVIKKRKRRKTPGKMNAKPTRKPRTLSNSNKAQTLELDKKRDIKTSLEADVGVWKPRKRGPGRPRRAEIETEERKIVDGDGEVEVSVSDNQISEIDDNVYKPIDRRHRLYRKPYRVNMKQSWTASSGFIINCKDCEFSFVKMLTYEDHLRKCHSTESPPENLKCESCSEEWPTYIMLMTHLEQLHQQEEKPFVCVYCPESFSTFQLYSLHRRHNHWIHPQELPCDDDDCDYACFSPKDLFTHMESHLKNDTSHQMIYSCDKCCHPFFSKQRLQIHALYHVGDPSGLSNRYGCSECPYMCLSTGSIANHFNNRHIDEVDKLLLLTCEVKNKPCKLYFFNKKNLKAHEEIHEKYTKDTTRPKKWEKTSTNRVFSCVYCNQEFYLRTNRDLHEETCPSQATMEEKRQANSKYVCPICKKGVKVRNNLVRHLTSHFPPAFECKLCDKKFRRYDNLQMHIESAHTKPVQLVCHICGRISAQPWAHKYHMTEHEKHHLCQECGRKFSRASLLKIHIRKQHTGEKLKCEWCDVFYSTLPPLKLHMQKCHEEKWKVKYGKFFRQKIDYILIKPEDQNVDKDGDGIDGNSE